MQVRINCPIFLLLFQTTPGLAKFFNCVMELIPPTYGLRVANVLALQLMEEIYSRNLTVFDM